VPAPGEVTPFTSVPTHLADRGRGSRIIRRTGGTGSVELSDL